MKFSDAPIQQKLTKAILLTSAVALFLAAAVFGAQQIIGFRKSLAENSETVARITAAQSSGAVDYENGADCRKILSKLSGEPAVLQAALYTKQGKLLARYPESVPAGAFPVPPPSRQYRVEHTAVNLFLPVYQDDRVVGALYLKWDFSPAYRRFCWDAVTLLLILAGSLGVAMAISRALQRRISGPILELAETARAVAVNRDYSVRAKKYGNDELGLLTDAFNQMLTRMGQQNEALRRSEEQLRHALQSTQAAGAEVRALNAQLEDRVAGRTAELAATNQALEAFTFTVSHDLRAPLRHIDSFARILEEEMAAHSGATETMRSCVGRIRLGAQNMIRLVDDLLNLSRLGQAGLQRRIVPLNSIVDDVLEQVKPDATGRQIDWRIVELPSASVDPGLIKQVFANLISNAIKYTRPRAKAVIEIGVEQGSGAVAIFVRDNGIGFDMNSAARLFEVFQRLPQTEEYEGHGIGLATVQRIIRLHGGKIWAEAELDKGATFRFTLPGNETAGQ